MSPEELTAVKLFMRIDGNEEDTLITTLYGAAVAYLKSGAGIVRPSDAEVLPLYSLAVWNLTLHYYEHRDAVGTESPIPNTVRPIINQLKAYALAG